MSKAAIHEFLITVLAIAAGLIAGKMVSKALASAGVPISSNDPLVMSLPVSTPVAVPIAKAQYTNVSDQNTPASMNSAGGN
jgi:type III secretion system FlhB-like substrate exporter